MILKDILWEDFINYKVPTTTLLFPYCDFKCGKNFCQNSSLIDEPNTIDIDYDAIIKQYLKNDISQAIVMQGLEPMDSFPDIYHFLTKLRYVYKCLDDVVIYTGYNENEISDKLMVLSHFKNIIVKFGRYIPNQEPHYDDILEVKLASDNQYAKIIS